MNKMLSIAIKQLSDRNCSEHDLRKYLEKEFAELPKLDNCINECVARAAFNGRGFSHYSIKGVIKNLSDDGSLPASIESNKDSSEHSTD